MFCFVEQLCIPDCGEVAKKAEAEAVFKELLASCTSRLARTTLGVRPHEEALFDIIRGSIMNLYKRDYIKSVPTKQEMQPYEGILCTERKAVGDRGFGKINHRRLYPAAVRHYDSLFPNNHIELFDFQNEGNMEQLNEEFCALIQIQTKETFFALLITDLLIILLLVYLSIIILVTTMHMSSRNLL